MRKIKFFLIKISKFFCRNFVPTMCRLACKSVFINFFTFPGINPKPLSVPSSHFQIKFASQHKYQLSKYFLNYSVFSWSIKFNFFRFSITLSKVPIPGKKLNQNHLNYHSFINLSFKSTMKKYIF